MHGCGTHDHELEPAALPLDHDWVNTHRYLSSSRVPSDLLPVVVLAARARLHQTIRRLQQEMQRSRLQVQRSRELQLRQKHANRQNHDSV